MTNTVLCLRPAADFARLDALPPYLPQAVIATEDRRFYQHFGIDPLGLGHLGQSDSWLAAWKKSRQM